jgi:Spy/CpxP family protein refolding chaperone
MIQRKHRFFGAAALALAAFALPGLLPANADNQGRAGERPAMHRMFGSGAPIISLALKHKGQLKLTTDQVAQLEKTRTHYQDQVTPLHQQLRALESEIFKLTQENPADLIQVKAKIQESEKLRSELRYLRIEALQNGQAILTAEQRDQLKSLLASQPGENRRQQKQSS